VRVRVSCVCGASRHIEPEALARLIGRSTTLEALAPRLQCSQCGKTAAEVVAVARLCDGRHNLAFYICWSHDLCAAPYRAHALWRTTVAESSDLLPPACQRWSATIECETLKGIWS
jgi:hypothetical protein